jgi:hypothetical protein
MIVEDDKRVRRLYELTMSHWGLPLQITMARDGFEALLRIGRRRPDVLIADLNMPGSGWLPFDCGPARERFVQGVTDRRGEWSHPGADTRGRRTAQGCSRPLQAHSLQRSAGHHRKQLASRITDHRLSGARDQQIARPRITP